MSQTIPLQATPNQSLTVTIDEIRYAITLKDVGGIMAATISIDEVEIISGIECVAGSLLIPYEYLENGNFTFVTNDDEIPYYESFGTSHFLVQLSQSELDGYRA